MRFRLLVALILLAGCSGQDERPNVVVIVIDALRQDHVGAYGYHRDTTPNIDAFAADGVVCRQATANCPWTSPAVTSLFTGLWPSVHGTTDHYGQEASTLPTGVQTLAEAFRDHGYVTAAFVTNSWLDPALDYDRGFETFDGINRKTKPRAAELNAKALPWLENTGEEPFFVYLHYFDVHGPYWAPPPYNKAFSSDTNRALTRQERRRLDYLARDMTVDGNDLNYYIDHYDGEIRYADHHVGRVLAHLEQLGLMENTIVVITSDHGESFFEHGSCEHGYTVHEPEISVPLIVRFPPALAARRSPAPLADLPVQLIDLGPTLLGAVGTEFANPIQGRDLLDPAAIHQDVQVWSEELAPVFKGAPKLALRRGSWKAIHDVAADTLQGLYDLASDPGELADLRLTEPDSAAVFAAAIARHLARAVNLRGELGITAGTAPISDDMKRKLESLGYTN